MTDLKQIKYWILDVDGTMTDGSIYYDEHGNEWKKFNTRDAAGFFALHFAGMKIVVLTGRECRATERRMKELEVDYIFQNIKDKDVFLRDFMQKNCLAKEQTAYICDDLNDLKALSLTGFVACPADACEEILKRADYVSEVKGGQGVIRDVAKYVLMERNEWNSMIKERYC